MPAGHATKTEAERALCEEMNRQGVPHEHGSLRFRVRMAAGDPVEFRPAVVARRGAILFLIESLGDASDPARTDLLTRFLEQHSPEIVLVVVARSEAMERIPTGAYDELYDAVDLAKLVGRIRAQEPDGMVRPFSKPRSGAGL